MAKQLSLAILALFILHSLSAQSNLIENGSFEQVNKICEEYHLGYEWFNNALSGWDGVSPYGATICDAQCEKIIKDKTRENVCPESIKPQHGNIMVQLSYLGHCMDAKHEQLGCASYTGYLLPKPLELGKTYEISYWIYLKKATHPKYAEHIGFNMYTKKKANQFNGMLEGSEFLLDTIIFNEWYQVKRKLKPLCDLKHIVFGTFRNSKGPETYQHTTKSNAENNTFFIDNVSLIELSSDDAKEAEEVSRYCKYEEKKSEDEPNLLDDVACYFETGKWDLNESSKQVLDKFAADAKVNNLATFTIYSHTDNIGSSKDNMELADKRMEAVQTYLKQRHKMPEFRFLTFSEGENAPSRNNDTEEGRAKNRRVDIRQTLHSLDDLLYRKIIQDVNIAADYDAALKKLGIWINLTSDFQKILMLNDPRLASLQEDKRWKYFKQKVHSRFRDKESLNLYQLWANDQRYRTLSKYIENLPAYRPHLDKKNTIWDVNFPKLSWKEIGLEDIYNLVELEKHFEKYGIPKPSEISWSANNSWILIIIHQEDIAIMEKYLPIYELLCREGEADWKYFAFLYDRFQVTKKEPQKYGTQFTIPETGGKQEMYPLQDSIHVNKFRDDIGLPAIDI